MHHAYSIAGDKVQGIREAEIFVRNYIGTNDPSHPDITVLSYGLFPVEEARRVGESVYRKPIQGEKKGIIVAVDRMFHEAQNALLKVFEEPPEGTLLILVVPSTGIIIPTLRSRLIPLTAVEGEYVLAATFLKTSKEERKKMVEKILNRTKSDKQSEKDEGRAEALALYEGVARAAYRSWEKKPTPALTAFLEDMTAFAPLFHEKAAPLKLMFEHMLITLEGLDKI